MNWESWFCSNQACTGGAWMVQRDPVRCDIWWVAAHVADRPFTVAATVPVCPRCGRLLRTMVEPEGRLGEPVGTEVRTVFDFIHQLT